jgi:hypothetical protein
MIDSTLKWLHLWNKDTSSGPKLLFSVQIAPWNEDTSEIGAILACPIDDVLTSQVLLYHNNKDNNNKERC